MKCLPFACLQVLVASWLSAEISFTKEPGPSSRRTPLTISEIMYHPSQHPDGLDLEFVEIYNSQPWDEDISGFRLDGAIRFEFPPSTTIGARSFVVVAKAPANLKEASSFDEAFGPWEGQLANDNETVRLLNSSGAVLLEVPYEDSAPWPLQADGLGHSIVLDQPSLGEADPAAWKASEQIGGSPGQRNPELVLPLETVVINEVYGNPTELELGFVEIMNRGSESIDLSGIELLLVDVEGAYRFAPGTSIPPAERLVVDSSSLPFDLGSQEILLGLRNPDGNRIIDAIKVRTNAAGLSFGKSPDGSNSWKWLSQKTPGQLNSPAWRPAVIFNEIMFNPISRLEKDEFIELINRSNSAVNVGGWQVAGGIDFTVSEGQSIAPGGFLVIAKDVDHLRLTYSQLDDTNTIGNYSGRLSNRGETLRLEKPAEFQIERTSPMIEIDSVRYRDRGRRSQWADGGGSSLELRDFESDNDIEANWGDSDESSKADWTSIEGVAKVESVSGEAARSLQIQLLGAGELLVDDVEVSQAGGTNRVRNSDFESTANWVFQGNHVRSSYADVDGGKALYIRASGRGDPHSNRIRQRMQSNLTVSKDATIRARVRWLRGHPEILFRTLGNHIEVFGRAVVPANLGTPGQQNSIWIANAGPTIERVLHSPVLPAANEPISVTAIVRDRQEIGSVRLIYRNDSTDGDEKIIGMVDDGSGTFTATIDGAAAEQLIAFHIEADDAANVPATNRFPAESGECLVRFGEEPPRPIFGDYRLWFTKETRSAWISSSRARTSNEPLKVTFVYNGERIIYDADATFSGSFFNSPNYDTPTGNPCDYVCKFPGNDQFLGARRILLSWPGLTGEPDRTAQHEQFSYWLAAQLGLPFNHRRYVGVTVNGVDRGVMEDTQRPNNDMLQQWFPGQSIEHFSKIQIRYEGNDPSNDIVDVGAATLRDITNDAGDKRTASYRWNWASQTDGATANDFSGIFDLVDAVNTSDDDAYTSAVRSLVDMEQWMRVFALEHTIGNWDSYGYGNGQNMYAVKPSTGKWQLMMWDLDIGSGSSSGESATTDLFRLTNPFFPQVNGDRTIVRRMYEHPEFVRHFWRTLQQAANGPMTEARVNSIVDKKFDKLREVFGTSIRSPSAIKTYMKNRREFILKELAENVSAEFSVQGVTGGNLLTQTNPVAIRGTAPVSVRNIAINGASFPVHWTSPTEWEFEYSLFETTTDLQIDGVTSNGDLEPESSLTVSIEFTGEINNINPNIVINEWMAINDRTLADPVDGDFEDWVELTNAGTEAIDLSGYTLTDDIETPTKWSFPIGQIGTTLAPGEFLLVWLDSEPDQNSPESGLHASFSLNGGGEEIGLFTPEGARMDAVKFSAQSPDISMGRTPDGSRSLPVVLSFATPAANNATVAVSDFRILEATLLPDGSNIRLTWQTQPGQSYIIESNTALDDPWQIVGDPITASADFLTADVPVPDESAIYFRISTSSE